MKNKIIFILTIFLFTACSKLLDEKPKAIAASNFYNKPAEVEAGLNAIYPPLRDQGNMGALYQTQLEIYTEYMYGRGSHAPLNTYTGLDNTNITRVSDMWRRFYEAIRDANIVIQKTPLGKEIGEADATRFIAEAKFMRGLIYFHLVRNWAGVPIRTEANMEDQNVPRSSQDDVYALILSDLTAAEAGLGETGRLPGAPTKWSAKAVLADVYMNMHDYQKAADEAKQIITSNKFSLVNVTVADDFDKLYGPEVEGSTEEVFFLKFSRTPSGQGFSYPIYAHYPNSGYYPPGGFYTFYSDSEQNLFVKQWDRADLRYVYNWYSQTFGLSPTTILNKKFSDKTTTTSGGNDYPMYRYADVLLFYAECAARVANAPTADAMEQLNIVHRRAYGKNPLVADASVDFKLANYSSLDAFINLVVRERTYEDCSEGKHWLDLKRLGIVKQVILADKGITVTDKHLLWPIPSNEYNYNKDIDPIKDQNPGY
ncbi:Starch-binding associating with outer membrane [Chitinophaga costaii]|uniref:Starch-binding associating with outer membrane n=1 Tax=Chitinophaga costaii TaxID=1335309 RepID=A0A1C4FY74_9BACT|nr:RagB/SusD family nutrient uptake outer membrane protein [Chitinophaga costaii]PUZ20918.1 RagB/SusD family nutrient uptake outer membrane protein [Chitinophaga costaii]SCC60927.1 Starch-binding associating with outer membrane [Chitinophaga costaii]